MNECMGGQKHQLGDLWCTIMIISVPFIYGFQDLLCSAWFPQELAARAVAQYVEARRSRQDEFAPASAEVACPQRVGNSSFAFSPDWTLTDHLPS